MGRDDIDIVDAIAEIGDQLQRAFRLLEKFLRDLVGHGGNQHIGGANGVGDLLRAHRRIVEIEPRVEQFAHAGLDRVRQLARDDNERLFLDRHVLLSRGCSDLINPVVRHCRNRVMPALACWVRSGVFEFLEGFLEGFRGSPRDRPGFPDGDIRAVLVFGVLSSLAEGRAKTRTPEGTGFHKPRGQRRGVRVFERSVARVSAQRIWAGFSAGDELMALGRFYSVVVVAGCLLGASVSTALSAKDSRSPPAACRCRAMSASNPIM